MSVFFRFYELVKELVQNFIYCWNAESALRPLSIKNAISERAHLDRPFQKIPFTIHQTHESEYLPWDIYSATQQLIHMNPTYQYKFYNAQDRVDFITENFGADSDELRAYTMVLPGTWKSDLFRLCVLCADGGVYMDCKGTTIVPIHKFLGQHADFASFVDSIPTRISTGGFLASTARNPIIETMLRECVATILSGNYGSNQLDIGGPETCGRVLLNFLRLNKLGSGEYIIVRDGKHLTVELIGRRRLFGEYLCDVTDVPVIKRQPFGYLASLHRLKNRYEIAWVLKNAFRIVA